MLILKSAPSHPGFFFFFLWRFSFGQVELDDILNVHCHSPEHIDQTLRSFLRFASTYRGKETHFCYFHLFLIPLGT